MERENISANTPLEASSAGSASWEPPRFEVISLSCEITSYAPDDEPLF